MEARGTGLYNRLPSADFPHDKIQRDPLSLLKALAAAGSAAPPDGKPLAVLLVCRRGNDSLLDARLLREKLTDSATEDSATVRLDIKDVRGGLRAWAARDSSFPVY